jgi:hypothetical protein
LVLDRLDHSVHQRSGDLAKSNLTQRGEDVRVELPVVGVTGAGGSATVGHLVVELLKPERRRDREPVRGPEGPTVTGARTLSQLYEQVGLGGALVLPCAMISRVTPSKSRKFARAR